MIVSAGNLDLKTVYMSSLSYAADNLLDRNGLRICLLCEALHANNRTRKAVQDCPPLLTKLMVAIEIFSKSTLSLVLTKLSLKAVLDGHSLFQPSNGVGLNSKACYKMFLSGRGERTICYYSTMGC